MKGYTPQELVATSRYQNYFPTLPEVVQEDVYARRAQLLQEERAYCDKAPWLRPWPLS